MTDSPTHYDTWFSRLVAQGSTEPEAAVAVIHRFLDGKPSTGVSPAQRDEALWTSDFWRTCPDEIFHTEAFALAFAKYLGRDGESGFTEQRRALFVAPDACKRAIRYSKVFLSPGTARWRELHRLLEHEVKGYRGFVRECLGMSRRYMGLRRDADAAFRKLSRLPLMDLIVLASMSAFKTELPPFLGVAPPNRLIPSPEFRYPLFTEAVARLLARRLADCAEEELSITEEHIRRAFQRQMYPLLRANHFDGGLCSRNLHTFECYVDAQLRLDAFRQNEISNFCFDGFSTADQRRISEDLDSGIRPLACFEPWVRSSLRGMILREHWNNVGYLQWEQGARATGAMAPADGSLPPLAKAFADLAILHDLYGLDSKIDLGAGVSVHLDQACLFLELARDMGIAGLLTSDLFKLQSSLDRITQDALDTVAILSRRSHLAEEEQSRLKEAREILDGAGFHHSLLDPLMEEYFRARYELTGSKANCSNGLAEHPGSALRRRVARKLLLKTLGIDINHQSASENDANK